MHEKLLNIIVNMVEEINSQRSDKVLIEKGIRAPLYGEDGPLDSLALVSLIVAVEQEIEDEFLLTVTLADEKAMSSKNSPFRTVGTLVEHVHRLIKDEKENG